MSLSQQSIAHNALQNFGGGHYFKYKNIRLMVFNNNCHRFIEDLSDTF